MEMYLHICIYIYEYMYVRFRELGVHKSLMLYLPGCRLLRKSTQGCKEACPTFTWTPSLWSFDHGSYRAACREPPLGIGLDNIILQSLRNRSSQ